jgi:hypothetical protein
LSISDWFQEITFNPLLSTDPFQGRSSLTGKNSFVAKEITVGRNRLVLFDDQNRVMLCSMDGKCQTTVRGRGYSISDNSLLVEEESSAEKLALYDLSTSEKHAQYTFESPVILSDFSSDGERLLVTAYQTICARSECSGRH